MLDWLQTILGDHYSADIDKKVSEEIGKGFVARADFNAVNTAKKQMEAQIADRDKQLEDIKKQSGDAETLKQALEKAEADNKAAALAHAAEMEKLRFDTAVNAALAAAKARNPDTVKPLLKAFLDKAEWDGGTIKGLDKELARLAADEKTGFLFQSDTGTPAFGGVTPADGLPSSVGKPNGESIGARLGKAQSTADTRAENPYFK